MFIAKITIATPLCLNIFESTQFLIMILHIKFGENMVTRKAIMEIDKLKQQRAPPVEPHTVKSNQNQFMSRTNWI